jgi:hypothetical protein
VPVLGTFDQVTAGVRALMGAAREGAEPEGVRAAFNALRDQLEAAERESRAADPDSPRHFEDVAALLCGDAFWPAILAVSEGRDPSDHLERAAEATRWLLRAQAAFVKGKRSAQAICLRRAATVVSDARGT